MVVGETGTGKTTLIRNLQQSINKLSLDSEEHEPCKIYQLNPKSVTNSELFGWNDILTNTFTHGIVSKIIQGALEEPENIKKWVLFDGPVDADWIENMNTVLDDNKMLCLPDGKRIKLPNQFLMLFEVENLNVASPATVSRCGMVYLDNSYVTYIDVL